MPDNFQKLAADISQTLFLFPDDSSVSLMDSNYNQFKYNWDQIG